MRKVFLGCLLIVFTCSLGSADVPPSRRFTFDYEVTIVDIPQDVSDLQVWLPLMPEKEYQRVEKISFEPFEPAHISEDRIYGNKILHFSFEPPFEETIKIRVRYDVQRFEYSKKIGNGQAWKSLKEAPEDLAKFLKADKWVTLSQRVKDLATEVTNGKETTLDKARAIYEYVFENVVYNKEIPGWGQGDTERVCTLKAGNCTDFHSLFISLARASGIPAKFIMGVPLKPDQNEGEVAGYHCWAEFFDEEQGWIPVDISEAWKDKSKYEYHFGTLDENRVEFTQGRDIVLEPNPNGEALNYFIYPYAEVDGHVHKGIGILYKYKNRDTEVVEKKQVDQLTKK